MNSVEISSIVLSILFIPLFIYLAFEGDIKGFFVNYRDNIKKPKGSIPKGSIPKGSIPKSSKKRSVKKSSPRFRKRLIPKI